MIIKKCIKKYDQGICKAIPPEQTCRIVLKKLHNTKPQILREYFEVQRKTKIPQFRIIGTDHYQQIVKSEGTNGKGHFREQALASGIMELAERYSCYKYLCDNNNFKISSFNNLKNNIFQFHKFYSNFFNIERVKILDDKTMKSAKLRWYKGYDFNGKSVYLPLGLINFILEGTNGMAAGNSLEEALLQGTCEVIERNCLDTIEINKLKTPSIDPATIDSPIAIELINKFKVLRQKLFIKDFSLGIGIPVIGVVRKIDAKNCIISAGAATSFEEALIRALAENSQYEEVFQYNNISLSKHHFLYKNTVSAKSIVSIKEKDIKSELEKVNKLITKNNMKIFFVNTTDKALNIPSVIVYIEGAKHIDREIAYRNLLIALIEESFAIDNCLEVKKYIDMGDIIDANNRFVYCYYQGVLFQKKGDCCKAIKYFLRALKGSNNFRVREITKSSLLNLGFCYRSMNNKNKALFYYLKAAELFPESYLPFNRLRDLIKTFKHS